MQFEGGYRYPAGKILLILTILSLMVVGIMRYVFCLKALKTIYLFFTLEGSSLIASAFTPIGLTPPSSGIMNKIKWIVKNTKGIPMSYNQTFLYGGLLFLFIGAILSVVPK